MKLSEESLECEKQILKLISAGDDVEEDIILEQFEWETVEPALIRVLLEEYEKEKYSLVSRIVWDAIMDGNKIRNDVLVALLNLRLNTERTPYHDNTVWSITSRTYGLSYDCSEYNPFKDLRLELKLNMYGLSFRSKEEFKNDACDGCPVIADYSKLSKCPECGKDAMMTTYDGACMFYQCQNCGCEIIGASFYPKCSLDATKYTIRISRENYSKKQILLLARLFGYTLAKMFDFCSSDIDLELVRDYKDALEIMKQCWTAGLACCISPMPPYCQFGKCSHTVSERYE